MRMFKVPSIYQNTPATATRLAEVAEILAAGYSPTVPATAPTVVTERRGPTGLLARPKRAC